MENFTKTIERLEQFIGFKNISFNKLAIKIDVSNSYFSKMVRNKASIGSDILEKIVRIFPDLNVEWLLTGDGEMIKGSQYNISLNESEISYKKLPAGPCQQCEIRDQLIISLQKNVEQLEWRLQIKNKK